MDIQTVTIFRTWVEIAATLKTDAERGKLYHSICEYALFGIEPQLEGGLQAFFTLMRPSIDKSIYRKIAQQKSLQIRLQNKSQTDLQNDLPNKSQNKVQTTPQNDVQSVRSRVHKTETETEKKTVTKVTAKEKVSFAFMLPDHLQCSDVDVKWKEWESFRRKKGKPISEAAARIQMKMLADLTREEAIAAIENSIANDYQGLFPPRHKQILVPRKDYNGI